METSQIITLITFVAIVVSVSIYFHYHIFGEE